MCVCELNERFGLHAIQCKFGSPRWNKYIFCRSAFGPKRQLSRCARGALYFEILDGYHLPIGCCWHLLASFPLHRALLILFTSLLSFTVTVERINYNWKFVLSNNVLGDTKVKCGGGESPLDICFNAPLNVWFTTNLIWFGNAKRKPIRIHRTTLKFPSHLSVPSKRIAIKFIPSKQENYSQIYFIQARELFDEWQPISEINSISFHLIHLIKGERRWKKGIFFYLLGRRRKILEFDFIKYSHLFFLIDSTLATQNRIY